MHNGHKICGTVEIHPQSLNILQFAWETAHSNKKKTFFPTDFISASAVILVVPMFVPLPGMFCFDHLLSLTIKSFSLSGNKNHAY